MQILCRVLLTRAVQSLKKALWELCKIGSQILALRLKLEDLCLFGGFWAFGFVSGCTAYLGYKNQGKIGLQNSNAVNVLYITRLELARPIMEWLSCNSGGEWLDKCPGHRYGRTRGRMGLS